MQKKGEPKRHGGRVLVSPKQGKRISALPELSVRPPRSAKALAPSGQAEVKRKAPIKKTASKPAMPMEPLSDPLAQEAFGEVRTRRDLRKRENSRSKYGLYKKPVKPAWWATPIAVAMAAVFVLLGSFLVAEIHGYAQFLNKKNSVNRATFYPGVLMEGVDLSSMTLDQALEEWGARDQKAKDALALSLVLGEQRFPVDADALGYSSDYQQVLLGAWSIGRYGTLEERFQVVSSLRDADWRRDFNPTRTMDEGVALNKLAVLAKSLSVPAVDASVESFDLANHTFTFTDSRAGFKVDEKELLDGIKSAAANGHESVDIVRHDVPPKDTTETLKKTYGSISTATTDASTSTNNRLTNLRVACKVLNGHRVEPGETFSFNETLGVRTAKKGYKPAGAYENGITTNQVGGGICQISSTLFNAIAKADMKIVERSPHSRPSSYVGLGKDAAVNWPNQDFKFTNTSDYPIYITAKVTSKKKVSMAVYGKKLPGGITIEIASEKNNTYLHGAAKVTRDPKLLPGEKVVVEEARNGYTATAYRVYKDANGKTIKTVPLGKSYYPPSGAIVRVGE